MKKHFSKKCTKTQNREHLWHLNHNSRPLFPCLPFFQFNLTKAPFGQPLPSAPEQELLDLTEGTVFWKLLLLNLGDF